MIDKLDYTIARFGYGPYKAAHKNVGMQRPHFGIMPVIKDQITTLRRHNA
jgi:hypothetical protein